MARRKQAVPVQRAESSEYVSKQDRAAARTNGHTNGQVNGNGSAKSNGSAKTTSVAAPDVKPGFQQAIIAVAGIYGSFLTWGYLQEKLTTTKYPTTTTTTTTDSPTEVFHYPVFLNTVQSALAALAGMLYLWVSTPRGQRVPPIVPQPRRLLPPLLLVALTSSLASPFGYASLAHIDYITYLLAKSCKLLPVMFLHVTLYRRRYPLYKYGVVAAVTAGVAVFTLHGHARKSTTTKTSSGYGLFLLSLNLLLDGLTNSTQDYIFTAMKPFSGPQMMCANSLMQTAVTGLYLTVVLPLLLRSPAGTWLGLVADPGTSGELAAALGFLQRHPTVWRDVVGFSLCGAVGQIFIFYALSTFSSVFLVTVTVTRKMCTMMLSVVAFGHHLTRMQWVGVGLVFGGVGVEAQIARTEKLGKQKKQ